MPRFMHKSRRHIGLQIKALVILTLVVLFAVGGGGSIYYVVTRSILQDSDYRQAEKLASGLAVAAGPALLQNNREALLKLSQDLTGHPVVHSVTIIDRDGRLAAQAQKPSTAPMPAQLGRDPPALSYHRRWGEDFLELARPVIFSARGNEVPLVGGVRLMIDTRPTAAVLGSLRREMMLLGALIVLASALPGCLLVWWVVVKPIRKLAHATLQLSCGDLTVRIRERRHDEIGELSAAFDIMAERLQQSQAQLRGANECLEQKVAQRTAELERSNHRLRHEMAEKEDFLRAVSHDLNGPLRNIAGMVTMLNLRQAELSDDVRQRLERIKANVDLETELLNELLELSRLRTRRETRRLLDFGSLLEELRNAFDFDLQRKGVELLIGPMPRLWVERNRMRQVFQNLIENAIKYMGDRPDGRIEIGYRSEEGLHHFTVADNGPGIAPEEHERIFHVFRRVATPANAGVPGKGVGLAVVRTIAANYDGRAWVESQPGHGATFHVCLAQSCTVEPENQSPPAPSASAAPALSAVA